MLQSLLRVRSLVAVSALALLATALAYAPPAAANGDTFDITIYHGINGRSLGFDKDLPVDIHVGEVTDEPAFSNISAALATLPAAADICAAAALSSARS